MLDGIFGFCFFLVIIFILIIFLLISNTKVIIVPFLLFILISSIQAYRTMEYDKKIAIQNGVAKEKGLKHEWRVPNSTHIFMAKMFGSFGIQAAMNNFKHKIGKRYNCKGKFNYRKACEVGKSLVFDLLHLAVDDERVFLRVYDTIVIQGIEERFEEIQKRLQTGKMEVLEPVLECKCPTFETINKTYELMYSFAKRRSTGRIPMNDSFKLFTNVV